MRHLESRLNVDQSGMFEFVLVFHQNEILKANKMLATITEEIFSFHRRKDLTNKRKIFVRTETLINLFSFCYIHV